MRPPSDSHFKPLEHPPPPDSSYHKHGALIAFLESIHAILCFVYAMWCREYPLRHTDTAAWTSIGSVLDWCESHVGKGGFNAGEREEALVGLVHMVRAFIESRNALLSSRHYVRYEMGKLAKQGDDTANAEHRRLLNETRESALKNNPAFRHLRDPPTQLPSPAPTANGSASSTPTANRAEGTPLQSSIRTPPSSSGSEQPKTMLDLDQFVLKSTASPPAILQTITLPLRGNVAKAVSQQAEQLHRAIKNVESYQSKLSLPILAKHFPITFARVIQTTLQQHEEYEPDFEDDEGELFWPGQCINGEGIGWVCLLGRSMIKEFGKDIGYQGYRGFVRLPDWRTNSKLPPGHPALQLPDIPDCW
ncbi:hypothetical protein GLOTRDRAFT_74095 [Gloeophyllum trabeum ATCC 11539]|uniref:Uncharacterized protein n=1 Tax=Gloeophyllum trabeum (strain ATCC 11539 / FP-39264 / Madison 617) TaxID=670483 RepID=S7RVR0_GLOTA|nr:uncharacterized protein GLOTRDRAFT_74095 [Gloeophyllum trabeum ATCC 11539]EPQ57359.1 hypothetical protein GLOTRDRAFT_74095 [Gloeophyllum trabeum ATCC 11539]